MSSRVPQSKRLYTLDMKQPYPDCGAEALASVVAPYEQKGAHYAGMRAIVECNGMTIPAVIETVVRIASQASEREITKSYGQCKPRAIQVAREVMRKSCVNCPVAMLNQ